jgi:hypothetical protein
MSIDLFCIIYSYYSFYAVNIAFLALQKLIAKGASHFALMVCWVISVVISNTCLCLVNAASVDYYWINLISYVTICMSYEIERNSLTGFIHAKVAKDATKKVDIFTALAIYCVVIYIVLSTVISEMCQHW